MYLAVDRQTIDPRLSMHCTLAGPELPLSPQTRQWRGNRGPRGSKHSALKFFFFQRETVACFVNFYCLGNFAQVLWAFNRELNRISRQGRSHRPNVFFSAAGKVWRFSLNVVTFFPPQKSLMLLQSRGPKSVLTTLVDKQVHCVMLLRHQPMSLMRQWILLLISSRIKPPSRAIFLDKSL